MRRLIDKMDLATILYGICVFGTLLTHTSLSKVEPLFEYLIDILMFGSLGLASICCLWKLKVIKLDLILIGALLVLSIVNYLFFDAAYFLIFICIFMLLISGTDTTKIFKTYFIVSLFTILFTLFLCVIGIIPNTLTLTRYSLGFAYTTFGPNIFLSCVVSLVAWKKDKINILVWALMLFLNIIFYVYTHTLAVNYCFYALLILWIILKLFKIQFHKESKLGAILTFSLPVFIFILTIIIFEIYCNNYNTPFFINLNRLLSNRLSLTRYAFSIYKIPMFGQNISWVTGTTGNNKYLEYFYVDSSYFQILLQYGIVIFIITMIYICFVSYYTYKTKDIYMFLALLVMLVHCMTDPQLLSFRHNPFIIIGIYCMRYILKPKDVTNVPELVLN